MFGIFVILGIQYATTTAPANSISIIHHVYCVFYGLEILVPEAYLNILPPPMLPIAMAISETVIFYNTT